MIWATTFTRWQAFNGAGEFSEQVFRLFSGDTRERIKNAYGEIIANAVKASYDHNGVRIHLAWELHGDELVLTVVNEGVSWEPTDEQRAGMAVMPDQWDLGGRGLPLIYLNTDSIAWKRLHNATMTIAKWRLPPG